MMSLRRVLTILIAFATPPATALGAGIGLAQASTTIGDQSAITIGLAMGAMIVVGTICLWVGRKTGVWDLRMKYNEVRIEQLAQAIEKLPCHDSSTHNCSK